MKKFWFVAALVVVLTSCHVKLDHTKEQAEMTAKKSLTPLGVVEVSCDSQNEGCRGGSGLRTCIGRTEKGIAFRGECDAYHCINFVVGAW